MSSSFSGPILLGIMVIVVLGIHAASMARARSLIQSWAERNGYQVVNQEFCWFWKGPFFWSSSRSQVIYYVTFADDSGFERRAYVRCGSWLLGLLSDEVDVRWEDL